MASETAMGRQPGVARATVRYLRSSAQKTRLVVDLVRGKNVADALTILKFTRKAVARPLEKLLWSAVANAKEREGLKDDRALFVERVSVDRGPALKRIRANSMGRAFRIIKRTCHVTFVLGNRPEKSTIKRAAGSSAAPAKQKK